MTEEERYPVGEFSYPEDISRKGLESSIQEIIAFPGVLRETLVPLSEEELDRKTLPGVWTIRQVTHHVADSHMNAFIRFKLMMTEEKPVIRPYPEGRFAELPDGNAGTPVEISLNLLEALHQRWGILLTSLTDEDMKRLYHHPDDKQDFTLGQAVGIYSYHGRHHLGHIKQTIARF